jgi:hypothetical protein
MKKFTILLSALFAFSASSFADDINTEEINPQAPAVDTQISNYDGEGYYRLKNASGRYLKTFGKVIDTNFTPEAIKIFNTAPSLNMVDTYAETLNDPGTIFHITEGQNGIDLGCQFTSLLSNENYGGMMEALQQLGVDPSETDPAISIIPSGVEAPGGGEYYLISTFENFGPAIYNAYTKADETLKAQLEEFAVKVGIPNNPLTGKPYMAGLKNVERLYFTDAAGILGDEEYNAEVGGEIGAFTISYDFADPTQEVIVIGTDGVGVKANSKNSLWAIEALDEQANIFGLNDGAQADLTTGGGSFYQTLYVDFPFEVSSLNPDVKVWYAEPVNLTQVSPTQWEITMTQLQGVVPAGTPVLVEFPTQAQDKTVLVPVVAESEPVEGNLLQGTIILNTNLGVTSEEAITASDKKAQASYDPSTQYLFGYGKENNALGFYTGENIKYLRSNRAYFDKTLFPNVSGSIKLNFGDKVVDAIDVINAQNTVKNVYDLSGRRVENPTTGLYIVNGKKVLVK